MKRIVSGFVLGLLISACAGVVIPKIEYRILEIHKSGRLVFKYCKDRKFFGNKCKEWQEDFYDLSSPEVRAQLKDFRCSNKLHNL